MYERRHELSDADIEAVNYMDSARTRNFKLGRYEPDYLIEDMLEFGHYELGETKMYVDDPAWGEALIGDQPHDKLLLELARTPLFRRLQSIEQLTLGPDYATMPNSMQFSRWQHIWGSLVFVRKVVAGREDIDPRESMVLQLRTLLSDVGHTAFSHLGDWMFQGLNGGENLHDKDLKDILKVSGVEGMLNRHGFSVEETVFPEIEDWVESPSPDLCVDRVDYGTREILRWGAPTIPLHLHKRELHDPGSLFAVDDMQRLTMTSQQLARYFVAGFSLLPTEHWSHPVHRLQLQLLQSAVRSAVIDKTEYSDLHPREALYGIDNDFYSHFRTWDMLHLHTTMKQIALSQRQIFMSARRSDFNSIFAGIKQPEWKFPAFPDPLQAYTWESREYGFPYSPQLVIEEAEVGVEGLLLATDRGLQVQLPPLKARSVDPLVSIDDEVVRFSELEPTYEDYLAGQQAVMAKGYQATVLMRPDIARRIVDRHQEAEATWPALLKRQRDAGRLSQVIRDAEPFAAVGCFDEIWEADDPYIESHYTPALGHCATKTAREE